MDYRHFQPAGTQTHDAGHSKRVRIITNHRITLDESIHFKFFSYLCILLVTYYKIIHYG